MFKKSIALFLGVSLIISLFVGCQSKESETQQPSSTNEATQNEKEKSSFPSKKVVEIVAPASPGGGWDSTARAIQKVIKDNNIAPEVDVVVSNKPGGKGSIAWNMLIQREDAHMVAMDSSYIYLNELLGIEGAQTYKDVRPVVTLTNEWIAVYVKADSKFQTVNEIMDVLKGDPAALKFGLAPGKGNDDHMATMSIAKAAGVDIVEFDKNIIATTTGELIPGLLGGFYDVVVTGANEGAEFLKSGDLRAVAITSDERIGGDFADVPTVKESGIDVVFPHWRGILAHPGMTDEEVAWWENVIEQVVATDDWKKILENNAWIPYYKNSADTMAMWEKEYTNYEELTSELGLKK